MNSRPAPLEIYTVTASAPEPGNVFAYRELGEFHDLEPAKAVALAAGTASVWRNMRVVFKCIDGKPLNLLARPIAVTTICGLNETARPYYRKRKSRKPRKP